MQTLRSSITFIWNNFYVVNICQNERKTNFWLNVLRLGTQKYVHLNLQYMNILANEVWKLQTIWKISVLLRASLHLTLVTLYRMFHLKRNPNYYPWTVSRTKRRNQWQYLILAAVSRCCSWCTALNRCARNFSYFVAHVTNKHFLYPEILLPVGALLSYTVLVRIRIAKCFTNSRKQFRCEVMFKNEHTMFGPAQLLRTWREQRPSNKGDLNSNVTREIGRVFYTGVHPISDFVFVP
jgi:hypothetical protein